MPPSELGFPIKNENDGTTHSFLTDKDGHNYIVSVMTDGQKLLFPLL